MQGYGRSALKGERKQYEHFSPHSLLVSGVQVQAPRSQRNQLTLPSVLPGLIHKTWWWLQEGRCLFFPLCTSNRYICDSILESSACHLLVKGNGICTAFFFLCYGH